MYWKYVVRRIIYCIITYIAIIFIYSALFNTVMDATLTSQIRERIQGEMMTLTKQLNPDELRAWQIQKLEYYTNKYHLNEPTINRIFWRAVETLTFNFGTSTLIKSDSGSREVFKIVMERVPNTLLLFGVATVIDIVAGIWMGLKKAQKPNKWFDQMSSILTMIVFGLPMWWLAMLFIMIFAYLVPIFPSGGLHTVPPPTDGFAYFVDALYHLALPVLTLTIFGFWGRAYLTRNIVLGTLQEDFIMSARARGLSEAKVLYGHTLRTAAPPIVTMSLMALLGSIGGNLLFEGIFNWPGMGNLYWISVQQNDIPVLMGNLALTTALYLMGIVILDLIYGFLDPRIKVGGKA